MLEHLWCDMKMSYVGLQTKLTFLCDCIYVLCVFVSQYINVKCHPVVRIGSV